MMLMSEKDQEVRYTALYSEFLSGITDLDLKALVSAEASSYEQLKDQIKCNYDKFVCKIDLKCREFVNEVYSEQRVRSRATVEKIYSEISSRMINRFRSDDEKQVFKELINNKYPVSSIKTQLAQEKIER